MLSWRMQRKIKGITSKQLDDIIHTSIRIGLGHTLVMGNIWENKSTKKKGEQGCAIFEINEIKLFNSSMQR